MNICLKSAGISRNRYIGSIEPYGIQPFRLNVGPDEVFEICHPDGSPRSGALHHGEVVSIGKSGRFLDADGTRLSIMPSSFVMEKLDEPQGRIGDGDRISLRSSQGWLASGFRKLKAAHAADPSEIAFHIYEIPGFSRKAPLALLHGEKKIESLDLGPHGRASNGEARVHVNLDKAAPPGGILVAFSCNTEHKHAYISPILLDGTKEGYSPIHFVHAESIPECGIRLDIAAEIPCTGESSTRFYGGTDGLRREGTVSLSVYRPDRFEFRSADKPARSGKERRNLERRMQERRWQDRRSRAGFDNHFQGKRPGILHA